MCFFNCLLVCWCFVCVGTSLFYHCGLLLVHLFILVCVWENEMGSTADWPDALQEALWNIRGLRGRARRGPDWLESLTHSLQHTDSVTPQITTTPSQPQPHNLDPCTASTPNTHTHTHVWDYIWRNGHFFSFCCPKWTRRSLSFTTAGKPSVTNTKLCWYWLMSLRVLPSPRPTIRARFHFSPAHPPRGRGGADVCLILSIEMYKHCEHILNK